FVQRHGARPSVNWYPATSSPVAAPARWPCMHIPPPDGAERLAALEGQENGQRLVFLGGVQPLAPLQHDAVAQAVGIVPDRLAAVTKLGNQPLAGHAVDLREAAVVLSPGGSRRHLVHPRNSLYAALSDSSDHSYPSFSRNDTSTLRCRAGTWMPHRTRP